MLPHEKPLRGYHKSIGGSAGKYTHGGDTSKPENMPSRDDADYLATNYDELSDALQDAGSTVYIDAHIDVSRKSTIDAAGGNTIVGQYCDPAVESVGNWIRHDDNEADKYTKTIIRHRAGSEPLTMYGVYMLGPRYRRSDEDHTADGFDDMLSTAVWDSASPEDGRFKVIGCRFSGWTWAGISIGAKRHPTDARVRRCTFNKNNFNHYGYGINQFNGDLWVDRCFFDDNRHWTAGFGYPTEETDITNCVGGPGPGLSHAWDKHSLQNNRSDGDETAGHHLRMRNCTTMQTKRIDGGPQEAVKIRGVTEALSWFQDCHFYHESPPDPDEPDTVQVIRQETDEWDNVEFADRNNHYGRNEPPDGVGAPRDPDYSADSAEQDEDPTPKPDPKEIEGETKVVQIQGEGSGIGWGGYWIYVSGEAVPAKQTEKNDVVKRQAETNVLVGQLYDSGRDTFEISKDASLVGAWFTHPCTVRIDGDRVDYLPSLVSSEANRRFDNA